MGNVENSSARKCDGLFSTRDDFNVNADVDDESSPKLNFLEERGKILLEVLCDSRQLELQQVLIDND